MSDPARTENPLGFAARLLNEVALGAAENHTDNLDEWNGVPMGTRSERRTTTHDRKYNAIIQKALAIYPPLFPQFELLSARLDDEASRDLLAKIIAYRMMGRRAVRLPLNNPEYYRQEREVADAARPTDISANAKMGAEAKSYMLDEIDMRPFGFDVTLLGQPGAAVTEYLMAAYRCPEIGLTAAPGDTVIDCGACWGDTSLHFAHDVGNDGQVHAFEVDGANLGILDKALALNRQLAGRIEVMQHALWDESGLTLGFMSNGPGTRVVKGDAAEGDFRAQSLTIDDFVDEAGLYTVDLIKMDIEGSESKALRGARRTIETYKPKLALSLYHLPHHYVELPRLITDWVPDYRLRLGHFSMSASETVLYAAVDPEMR